MCGLDYLLTNLPQIMLITIQLIIATYVAYVGVQQYQLAKAKFKMDMFQKRFDIFKAVEVYIGETINNKKGTWETLTKFNDSTETASFIFDDDVMKLINDLDNKGRNLIVLQEQFEPLPVGPERSELFAKKDKIMMQLWDIKPKLKDWFNPYLKFSKWK